MKHSNFKLFIMFSAGILLSAITVFAATVSIPSNFSAVTTQFLQKLILTDGSGATGVVLDGINKKIQSDTICETDGSSCKTTSDLLTSYTESDPVFMAHSGDYYTTSQSDAKYLTSYNELWNTGTSNSINYINGRVGIGTNSPITKLDVNGDTNINGTLILSGDINTNSSSNRINIGNTSDRTRVNIISDEFPDAFSIYNVADSATAFRINTEDYYILMDETNSDYNVGIGTNLPTSKLDVNGTGKFKELFINGLTTVNDINLIAGYTRSIHINAGKFGTTLDIKAGHANTAGRGGSIILNPETGPGGYGDIIIAQTGGNVGIGTNNPTTKFDVAGTATFNDIINEGYIKLGFEPTCDSATRGSIRYVEGDACAGTCKDRIDLCVLSNSSYVWTEIGSAGDTPDGSTCDICSAPAS